MTEEETMSKVKGKRTLTPRVINPTITNVVIGLILIGIGEKELGVGALLAALATGGVGYATRPTYPTGGN
jgi:hypothetical protein